MGWRKDLAMKNRRGFSLEFKRQIVERNLGALPKEGSADAGYSSCDNLEVAWVL